MHAAFACHCFCTLENICVLNWAFPRLLLPSLLTIPRLTPFVNRPLIAGVAPFQWHAGPLSCVRSEPCIGDEPITPLQGFCISSRAVFPGRCPGLEYCALSGLKIAFGSPCKGRLNKAQGNALRKGPRSTMMSPERARYVRYDSKDSSRPVRIAPRFLLFPKGGVEAGSRFPHGQSPRTVPPLKWSRTPDSRCGRVSADRGKRARLAGLASTEDGTDYDGHPKAVRSAFRGKAALAAQRCN